jgi:hypothetical protein
MCSNSSNTTVMRCCSSQCTASSSGHFIQLGGPKDALYDRKFLDYTLFQCPVSSYAPGTIANKRSIVHCPHRLPGAGILAMHRSRAPI